MSSNLWKLWLFINERHQVERPDGDEVEGLLVVDKLDVMPVDGLHVVLLLLQLEDVTNEKLLQIFVGIVDTKLEKMINLIFKGSFINDVTQFLIIFDTPLPSPWFLVQCPPLNRITLGQHKIDNINRMIQLTDVFGCSLFRGSLML